jgi:hypothetical protein
MSSPSVSPGPRPLPSARRSGITANAPCVLDVPENQRGADVAATNQAVSAGRIGPRFEIAFDREAVIDRRATDYCACVE